MQYTQKAGGGDYAMVSSHQFGGQGGFGTVFRLDGDPNNGGTPEELQIVNQDNLSTLIAFSVSAIGHLVED